jgi:hypothetical protein
MPHLVVLTNMHKLFQKLSQRLVLTSLISNIVSEAATPLPRSFVAAAAAAVISADGLAVVMTKPTVRPSRRNHYRTHTQCDRSATCRSPDFRASAQLSRATSDRGTGRCRWSRRTNRRNEIAMRDRCNYKMSCATAASSRRRRRSASGIINAVRSARTAFRAIVSVDAYVNVDRIRDGTRYVVHRATRTRILQNASASSPAARGSRRQSLAPQHSTNETSISAANNGPSSRLHGGKLAVARYLEQQSQAD